MGDGLASRRGVAVEGLPGDIGPHADERELVSHGVGQVAGDAQPLLGDPSPRVQLALPFRALGAPPDLGEMATAFARGGVSGPDHQTAERNERPVLRTEQRRLVHDVDEGARCHRSAAQDETGAAFNRVGDGAEGDQWGKQDQYPAAAAALDEEHLCGSRIDPPAPPVGAVASRPTRRSRAPQR
ncbi:hypothetical protein [Streptomyces sp. NPDC059863]|uniref:hypothetical protein n=1 Tax=unclassified Streptomyces TaxID=2593676 RepID=UPI00366995E9